MTAYLLRRLGTSIIVLIGISIFIFLLLHAIYPSPARDVLGLLFYSSLGKADYPVLLAYTLIGAVFVVLGNLVADIALTVADPRIRLA